MDNQESSRSEDANKGPVNAAPQIIQPTWQRSDTNPSQAEDVDADYRPESMNSSVPQDQSQPTDNSRMNNLARNSLEKGFPKKLSLVFTGIVLLVSVLMLTGAYLIYGVNEKSSNQYLAENIDKIANQETLKSLPEAYKSRNNVLQLEPLIDTKLTIRNQNIESAIGYQNNLGDGFSIIVSDSVPGWQHPDKNAMPGQGKQFLMVVVELGYRGLNDSKQINPSNFYLIDNSGITINAYDISQEYAENNFFYDKSSASFRPGSQQHGWVIFEVDKGDFTGNLIYEKKAFSYKGESVEMKARVAL